MKYIAALIATLSLSTPNSVLAAETSAKVPLRFQGEWAHDLKKCGSPEELYFKLGEKEVVFYESSGPIKAAVVRGNEIALIAELSGEGETWLATLHYELSKDGKKLSDKRVYPPEARHRCP
jgi:hypothetical protein